MTNCLPSNLEALAKRQPELAIALSTAQDNGIEVFPSLKGQPTARCNRADGQAVPLHSRYDPLMEARQALKKVDLTGGDYFVVLGFGLGYILDALLEETGREECHYFIIESHLGVLKAALSSRDFRPVLARCHVRFAMPASGTGLAEQWSSFFDPVRAKKSVFLTHGPSVSLDPALYKAAAEVIQSQTFQTFTDINTLVGRSQVFLDNFIQNLPRVISSPGVSKYRQKFPRMPAVLVSAGPSLDKNADALRGWQDSVLILAVDTAWKPLLSAGVEPHFVLTGDPTHTNYLHLKGAEAKDTLLIAEATTYPGVFSEFGSRTVSCIYENSSLSSLADLLGRKGRLRAWGSVATMGLDFALTIGCNPIIFVGQDLAHSDGRIYCSGVYFEESWFAGMCRPEQWRLQWENIRSGRRTITVEDIFGQPAETTDKLSAYWNWISKELSCHPEVRFVNATEGGILRDNGTICSLREALYRYAAPGANPGRSARIIFEQAKQSKAVEIENILPLLQNESAAIAGSLDRGIRLSREGMKAPSSDVLGQLDAIKNMIYANHHLAPLLDCLNQMGNIAFLRNQAALGKTSSAPGTVGKEICRIYEEYFESIRAALNKVESTLCRIEDILATIGI